MIPYLYLLQFLVDVTRNLPFQMTYQTSNLPADETDRHINQGFDQSSLYSDSLDHPSSISFDHTLPLLNTSFTEVGATCGDFLTGDLLAHSAENMYICNRNEPTSTSKSSPSWNNRSSNILTSTINRAEHQRNIPAIIIQSPSHPENRHMNITQTLPKSHHRYDVPMSDRNDALPAMGCNVAKGCHRYDVPVSQRNMCTRACSSPESDTSVVNNGGSLKRLKEFNTSSTESVDGVGGRCEPISSRTFVVSRNNLDNPLHEQPVSNRTGRDKEDIHRNTRLHGNGDYGGVASTPVVSPDNQARRDGEWRSPDSVDRQDISGTSDSYHTASGDESNIEGKVEGKKGVTVNYSGSVKDKAEGANFATSECHRKNDRVLQNSSYQRKMTDVASDIHEKIRILAKPANLERKVDGERSVNLASNANVTKTSSDFARDLSFGQLGESSDFNSVLLPQEMSQLSIYSDKEDSGIRRENERYEEEYLKLEQEYRKLEHEVTSEHRKDELIQKALARKEMFYEFDSSDSDLYRRMLSTIIEEESKDMTRSRSASRRASRPKEGAFVTKSREKSSCECQTPSPSFNKDVPKGTRHVNWTARHSHLQAQPLGGTSKGEVQERVDNVIVDASVSMDSLMFTDDESTYEGYCNISDRYAVKTDCRNKGNKDQVQKPTSKVDQISRKADSGVGSVDTVSNSSIETGVAENSFAGGTDVLNAGKCVSKEGRYTCSSPVASSRNVSQDLSQNLSMLNVGHSSLNSVKSVDSVKSVQSMQSVDSVKSAQSVKSVASVQSVKSVSSVGSARSKGSTCSCASAVTIQTVYTEDEAGVNLVEVIVIILAITNFKELNK